MKEWFEGFLKKCASWVPKNIGGIIGMVQAIITAIREICIILIRLVCPIIPGNQDEAIIQNIADVCKKINDALEKIKDFFLKVID